MIGEHESYKVNWTKPLVLLGVRLILRINDAQHQPNYTSIYDIKAIVEVYKGSSINQTIIDLTFQEHHRNDSTELTFKMYTHKDICLNENSMDCLEKNVTLFEINHSIDECKTPHEPLHGHVQVKYNASSGIFEARYYCDNGYEISENKSNTCLKDNGVWEEVRPPQCINTKKNEGSSNQIAFPGVVCVLLAFMITKNMY